MNDEPKHDFQSNKSLSPDACNDGMSLDDAIEFVCSDIPKDLISRDKNAQNQAGGWQINCTAPTDDVTSESAADIALPRGEKCILCQAVDWYELRKIQTGTVYNGPTMRWRLGPGLSWRFGKINHQAITSDEKIKIDDGLAYITNCRLLFMGKLGNVSIPYARILKITLYSDGVGIEKDRGKSPCLILNENLAAFHDALEQAILRFRR